MENFKPLIIENQNLSFFLRFLFCKQKCVFLFFLKFTKNWPIKMLSMISITRLLLNWLLIKKACNNIQIFSFQKYYRNIRSILNKITPQKFKKLLHSLTNLDIDTDFKMEKLAEFIIVKAVDEPLYGKVYARMCSYLINHVSAEKINLKLVFMCLP